MGVLLNRDLNGVSRTQMMEVYRHLLRVHGLGKAEAMGWRSRESQETRFKILTREVTPGESLIDYGCGLGDLSGYLKRSGLNVDYKGFDLLPDMVKGARLKYPQASFSVRGSLRGLPGRSYDRVLASGIFSYRLVDHVNHLIRTLNEFSRVARKGFSFDIPSSEHYREVEETYFTIDRESLERILKGNIFEVITDPDLRLHFVFVRTS